MIVLGIDPGSRATGYGIIESSERGLRHIDNGAIRPPSELPLAKRLQEIFSGLEILVAAHHPDVAVIEDVFVANNARSSLLLGQARGVALLAAAARGVAVAEYAPSQVKQAVTGRGHATKQQIQHMVRAILGLPEIAIEDASDALAVAICHCHSDGLRRRIAASQRS